MLKKIKLRRPAFRDCIETIPKSPQPPIMGEPEGGLSASFIPFMLPHYWGRGGARLFIQFLSSHFSPAYSKTPFAPGSRLRTNAVSSRQSALSCIPPSALGWLSLSKCRIVQVRIEDHGAGIPLGDLPKAALRRGYSTAGTMGHGFSMILMTASRIFLLTGPAGTTIVLEQDKIASTAG